MTEYKELMKPKKRKYSKIIESSDENIMMQYYSEGRAKSVSLGEFERMKIWNDEITRYISLELFNKALSEEELDEKIKKRMMKHLRNLAIQKGATQSAIQKGATQKGAKDINQEIEKYYLTVYNPLNSLVYLRKGLSKLQGNNLVKCITRDVQRKNTYYSLSVNIGVEWVKKQLAYAYKDQKWLFNALNKKNRLPIILLMMKWVELHRKQVDQLILVCSQPIQAAQLVHILKDYYLNVEGENKKQVSDADLLYQEAIQKLSKLMKIGYLEYNKEKGVFYPTKAGQNFIMNTFKEFISLIDELDENYVLTIKKNPKAKTTVKDGVEICKVGELLIDEISHIYETDLDLLAKPPTPLDDLDFHEDGISYPPIHLYAKKMKNKYRYRQKNIFELYLYKEISKWERFKNGYFTSGFNGFMLAFGTSFILIGVYSALINSIGMATGLLIAGGIMFMIGLYGVTVRWRMNDPKYSQKQVYKQTLKTQKRKVKKKKKSSKAKKFSITPK
jgi:hypothetical protein